jgi:hypothetical protein
MATTPYNPFADRKYSREQLLAVFSSKPTVNVTRLYNENPTMYKEMKLQAMEEHLLGPDSMPIQPAPYIKAATHVAPTSIADAELLSLPGMDVASLTALFKGSPDKHAIRNHNNAGQLAISDPNKYAASKRAAQLRGILHDPNKTRNQEPVQPSGSFMLSDSLCEKAQLPKGSYMDADSYGKLVLTLNAREVAKEEAAAKSEKS